MGYASAVIWIWLAYRNAVNWNTGPIDQYFTYVCHHCAAQVAAMVRTIGYGSGRDLYSAQNVAQANAQANAWRANAAAACPCCGQLQPATLGMFEVAAKTLARRKKLAIPVSLGLALVALLLIGIPGLADVKHSLSLPFVAVSVAGAIGALSFALFNARITPPPDNPSGLWFSHDPSQGPSSWFQARTGVAPHIEQPSTFVRSVAGATLAASAVAAIVGLVMYSESFRKVYVVNTAAVRGAVSVKIDGVPMGDVARTGGGDDVPFRMWEVRDSSSHHVVVTGHDGVETAYDLDPASSGKGWILAPLARHRGLCLTSLTWYYGTAPRESADDKVLNTKESPDRIDLQRSFDFMMTKPPSTIQTKNGSETRTTLRALECSSLAREDIVPFGNGPLNGI